MTSSGVKNWGTDPRARAAGEEVPHYYVRRYRGDVRPAGREVGTCAACGNDPLHPIHIPPGAAAA